MMMFYQAYICANSTGAQQNSAFWVRFVVIVSSVIVLFAAYFIWLHFYICGRKQTLSDKKYEVEKRKFLSRYNGKNIVGELFVPKTAGKIPLVICSHGFGVSYKTTKILVGNTLSQSGVACLCFDFYGGNNRSKSGGSMLEMSPLTEKEDLLAVFKQAKELDFVDKDNIFLFGESQGALVTALAENELKDEINGVILYYPAFCIPDKAKEICVGGIPERHKIFGKTVSNKYYDDALTIDIYDEIKSFNKPVLIVHGDADKTVDISYGNKASETYPNAEFVTLPKQYHGFSGTGKMKAVREVYTFIEKNKSEPKTNKPNDA